MFSLMTRPELIQASQTSRLSNINLQFATSGKLTNCESNCLKYIKFYYYEPKSRSLSGSASTRSGFVSQKSHLVGPKSGAESHQSLIVENPRILNPTAVSNVLQVYHEV